MLYRLNIEMLKMLSCVNVMHGVRNMAASLLSGEEGNDVEDLRDSPGHEMISREQRALLTKQGYRIVGSHRYLKTGDPT